MQTTQILHCFLFLLKAMPGHVFCVNYTNIALLSVHSKRCVLCADYTDIALLALEEVFVLRSSLHLHNVSLATFSVLRTEPPSEVMTQRRI